MALESPARDACFAVFSQRPDVRIDVAEWARHAERFFATKLSLDAGSPTAKVLLVTGDVSGGRVCWGRPRTEDDLRAARSADGGAGLADLAARCPHVWLVETDADRDADALALRLAAILAGVMLGPILSPAGDLFGPKTARQRLGV
jgi:hypothetical protein